MIGTLTPLPSPCTREVTGITGSGYGEEAHKEAELQVPGPSAAAKPGTHFASVDAIKNSSFRSTSVRTRSHLNECSAPWNPLRLAQIRGSPITVFLSSWWCEGSHRFFLSVFTFLFVAEMQKAVSRSNFIQRNKYAIFYTLSMELSSFLFRTHYFILFF